jgi:hypothetical protein
MRNVLFVSSWSNSHMWFLYKSCVLLSIFLLSIRSDVTWRVNQLNDIDIDDRCFCRSAVFSSETIEYLVLTSHGYRSLPNILSTRILKTNKDNDEKYYSTFGFMSSGDDVRLRGVLKSRVSSYWLRKNKQKTITLCVIITNRCVL